MMMSGGQNELGEPGLTYQRADGTVEHAVNMQDAINRCPVLGRLALADPNQLGVLMDLAAIGNEKMAVDAGDEPLLLPEIGVQTYAADMPEVYELSHVDSGREAAVSEPTFSITEVGIVPTEATSAPAESSMESSADSSASVSDIVESAMPEQTTLSTATVADSESGSSSDAGYELTDAIAEKALVTEVKQVRAIGAAAVSSVIVPQRPQKEPVQKMPMSQAIKPLKKSEPKKVTPLQSKVRVLSGAPAAPIVAPAMPVVSAEIGGNNTEVVVPAQKKAVESTVIKTAKYSEEPLSQQLHAEPSDELSEISDTEFDGSSEIIDSTPVTKGEEAVSLSLVEQTEKEFTPECIEVYQQLMAMDSTEVEPDVVSVMYPPVELKQLVALPDTTDGTTDMIAEETSEAPAVTVFEDFIESIVDKEGTSITFESMTELVSEDQQPLVQTFIQLAGILKNPIDYQPEHQGAYKAFADIKKQLHGFAKSNDAEKVMLQLTMELTEKLIELLRALGYEDPKNALIEFVAEHGVTRLLMTLEYLCRLSHDDYAQESLLVAVATSAVSDTEATRARIAKALFGITTKVSYSPGI